MMFFYASCVRNIGKHIYISVCVCQVRVFDVLQVFREDQIWTDMDEENVVVAVVAHPTSG
jgi:hypothetical protein